MNLTIGMAAYNNPEQVWWTLQGLKLYQDVEDCELLVVDNQGNEKIQDVCIDTYVRYETFTRVNGTGPARNAIFDFASGDFVLVLDSHVLLWPDAIKKLKAWLDANPEEARNMIHGPIVLKRQQEDKALPMVDRAFTHYEDVWRAQMWGTWAPKEGIAIEDLPEEAFEIKMMGCGLFGCRKDSWLRFHKDCRGFGGVEGIIHAKYRHHGRRVLCLPFMLWVHRFGAHRPGYPLQLRDRIRNFLLGFEEIGMDPEPIYRHYGEAKVRAIADEINQRL